MLSTGSLKSVNDRHVTLTQSRLKELVSYDRGTGLFTWLVTRRGGSAITGKVFAGTPVEEDGYLVITVDGRRYYAHRLAWLYEHGHFPESGLDHEDTIKSHNWISNLRTATRSQNGANRTKMRNNTSGFKGVVQIPQTHYAKPFRAFIRLNGKKKCLGNFATKGEAAAAYERAANDHFGEFARTT